MIRKYGIVMTLWLCALVGSSVGVVLASVIWHHTEPQRHMEFRQRFGSWVHRGPLCGGGWFAAIYTPLFDRKGCK